MKRRSNFNQCGYAHGNRRRRLNGPVDTKMESPIEIHHSTGINIENPVNFESENFTHFNTKQVSTLMGHEKGVNRIVWGKHVNSSHYLASCSMDSTVRIWDPFRTLNVVDIHTHHEKGISDVQWTCDGLQLVSGGYDGYVNVADVATGKVCSAIIAKNVITAIATHPTRKDILLYGDEYGNIVSYDTRSNRMIKTCKEIMTEEVLSIAFVDYELFVTACAIRQKNAFDRGVMVYDLKSGARMSSQMYTDGYSCCCVKVHPFKNEIIASSDGNYIGSFHGLRPFKMFPKKKYVGHVANGYRIQCDYSGDGELLASGDANGFVYVYNSRSAKLVDKQKFHSGVCMDVAFYKNSSLATCGWDKNINIVY